MSSIIYLLSLMRRFIICEIFIIFWIMYMYCIFMTYFRAYFHQTYGSLACNKYVCTGPHDIKVCVCLRACVRAGLCTTVEMHIWDTFPPTISLPASDVLAISNANIWWKLLVNARFWFALDLVSCVSYMICEVCFCPGFSMLF